MISIHALRVEGDSSFESFKSGATLFLSTPSGWRATINMQIGAMPEGGISIHALRVEGD